MKPNSFDIVKYRAYSGLGHVFSGNASYQNSPCRDPRGVQRAKHIRLAEIDVENQFAVDSVENEAEEYPGSKSVSVVPVFLSAIGEGKYIQALVSSSSGNVDGEENWIDEQTAGETKIPGQSKVAEEKVAIKA